ncbi:hypothetical protein L596_019054 [Steinernema carpocapsae]|uniref:Calponin-homology (CH) domain-containing protein n=1 Tax=Steinernema carpocapsae TaxID=34508 RepID=A0A4U5N6J0_STECR|nr:hypothetical protein L596_019054 [Steinernema carpocapsae]
MDAKRATTASTAGTRNTPSSGAPSRATVEEKRIRNRSLCSVLCTPPPYPGYSSLQSAHYRPSGISFSVLSGDSASAAPSLFESQIQRRKDRSKESSGYGSIFSSSSSASSPSSCSSSESEEFAERPSRMTAPRTTLQRQIERSRRKSVPASVKDPFSVEIVRVFVKSGLSGNSETDVASGKKTPKFDLWANRPESVLQLARHYSAVSAQQEVQRHRNRSSGIRTTSTSGPSTPVRDSIGGIASLSQTHLHKAQSTSTMKQNVFKQMDQQARQQNGPVTPRFGGGTFSPNTIKDALLRWCQSRVREYPIEITNFSSSWADGMAFCALVHRFAPNAFDFYALHPQNRKFNFELAFRVAEENGIVPLLEVEDMLLMGNRPDWKCVFTYVQSFYRQFKDCN